jgi:hypothetical protein
MSQSSAELAPSSGVSECDEWKTSCALQVNGKTGCGDNGVNKST